MLNITFSDDHIKQLIQTNSQTSSQQALTKEIGEHHNSTTDDESFEILPHLNEGNSIKESSGKCANSANVMNPNLIVKKISNTIGESQTDHYDKQRLSLNDNVNNHGRLKVRRSISAGKIDLSSYFNSNNKSLTVDDQNISRDEDASYSNAALEDNESTSSSEDILKPLPTSFHGQHNTTTESINNVADLSSIEESDLQSNKRRAVSVDNSQLTPSQTRRYNVNNNNTIGVGNQLKQDNSNGGNTKVATNGRLLHARASVITKKPNLQRAHSMSDLLDVNRRREKKFNKRKGFSSKLYRSGSISNILDDHYEEKSKAMSHEHWSTVVGNPERWFYCWHPLLGVNNLLSNWQ